MIIIRNSKLSAELLDPRADRILMGSRYCGGGHIWQIYDSGGNALLSGPHYPSASPPPFDGQGIPDAFVTPLGGEDAEVGGEVCVIGVGLVQKSNEIEPFHPRNNPNVTLPCEWDITSGADWAEMGTSQRSGEKAVELLRTVRVIGNSVESLTRLANTGNGDISFRWFPHPFFPVNPNLSCGKINPPALLPENAGYEAGTDGMIRMKPDYPWEKGLFQPLAAPPQKMIFTIPHPIAGTVEFRVDYNVTDCALWANARTFSFEPFMQAVLKPQESVEWKVSAVFGQPYPIG